MYSKYLKRIFDFVVSLAAFLILIPVLVILTVIGGLVLRENPFFVQPRPGKDEKIFRLIKFKSMKSYVDGNGKILSDSERITCYGKFIRETSLDELPSLVNIIKGDLAIVGPRPQLVKDMVFMTEKQRLRHTVRPGLTGLAQVNGRNSISWAKKLEYDVEYIQNITFIGDLKILLKTFITVFKREGITDTKDTNFDMDLGDFLLKNGEIDKFEYDEKQRSAEELINA